jgi:hypothetical protein
VAWSLATFTARYTLKLLSPPIDIGFCGRSDCLWVSAGWNVHLYGLRHAYEPWMQLHSPALSLQPLSYGLVLATFADSSVRVVSRALLPLTTVYWLRGGNAGERGGIAREEGGLACCPLTCTQPASRAATMTSLGPVHALQLDAGSIRSSARAAMTSTPQLSSSSMLAAACSLAGARLAALLTSGHVHVWQLHLQKPPHFVVSAVLGIGGQAWSKL